MLKIIINISFLTALLFGNFAHAGAELGGKSDYEIRIYCEYRDNNGKNTTFKLQNDDETTVKTASTFIRHIGNVRYVVGEPDYSQLVNRCKTKISNQGEFLRLKGTNAGNYEFLTSYYDVKLPNAP